MPNRYLRHTTLRHLRKYRGTANHHTRLDKPTESHETYHDPASAVHSGPMLSHGQRSMHDRPPEPMATTGPSNSYQKHNSWKFKHARTDLPRQPTHQLFLPTYHEGLGSIRETIHAQTRPRILQIPIHDAGRHRIPTSTHLASNAPSS